MIGVMPCSGACNVKKAYEDDDRHIAVNGCTVARAAKALHGVDVEPETSILVADAICYEKNRDLTDETRPPELVESVPTALLRRRSESSESKREVGE